MPRSFDMSTDYGVSVEEVLRAFSDQEYWLARLADSGADDTTLDSIEVGGPAGNDGSIDVITTQVLRSDRSERQPERRQRSLQRRGQTGAVQVHHRPVIQLLLSLHLDRVAAELAGPVHALAIKAQAPGDAKG